MGVIPLHACSRCLDNSLLGGKWGTRKARAGHPSRWVCSGAVGCGAAGCLARGWDSSGHEGAAQAEALVGSEGLDGDPWKILQLCKWGKGCEQLLLHDAKGTMLSENPFFVVIMKGRGSPLCKNHNRLQP